MSETSSPPEGAIAAHEPTEVKATIRQDVVASAWQDLKKFSTLLFLCTTLLLGWHTIRLKFGDAREYYAYNGSSGPFSVLLDDKGQTIAGEASVLFHPGDKISWVATFCANEGVEFSGHLELIRHSVSLDVVAARQDIHFRPDSHRCGPRLNIMKLPDDAVAGQYAIHRYVTFREGTWWPLTATFPDIPFTVEGLSQPIP